MSQTPQTPPATPAAPKPPEAAAPAALTPDMLPDGLVVNLVDLEPVKAPKTGTVVRVSAVHGRIQHPFTKQWLDTDSETKVKIDRWYVVQIEARKLTVVQD